jgi:putative redox protein
MVEITGTYEGDLRVRAVHGPSGAEVITDAPVDNHGRGEGFSPTDLIATSLGTCILTIFGILAERRGLDLAGASFSVRKEMVADPKRRIARLETTIRLPARLGEEDRRALEAAARACPVHESLSERVECPLHFVYETRAGGPEQTR